MVMVSAVGTDTAHRSEWDGDGTLDGVHLGLSASDGDGVLAGAGDLLGMAVTDLGVAGTAVATGDLVGMETATGVVVTGVTQDHVMLRIGLYTETTITHVVHHQDPAQQEDMTVMVLPEILGGTIVLG
jgi:hypothetical protein